MRQGRRLRGELVCLYRHVLCVRAVTLAIDVAEHLVANGDPRSIRPDRLDDARNLVAGDDRGRTRRAIRVEPRAAPVELARADATGVDANQDVARAEGRDRRILEGQLRRVAPGVGMQGMHRSRLLSSKWQPIPRRRSATVLVPNLLLKDPETTTSVAQRAEGRTYLSGEDVRLLPGGEVAALLGHVEVGEPGVDRLDPAARGCPDLAGERREADRHVDCWRSLAAGNRRRQRSSVLPVRAGRRC